MKKILITILTVAMMTSAVAAIADGGPQGGPMGSPMGGQPPRMEQGQQPPEKPDAAPEKPTGEKPADAPEEPEDMTGERPEMPSGEQGQAPTGEKPADAPEMPSGKQGQAPTGEKPADAPEMPSGEQGQAPQGQAPTGQQSTDGKQAPQMIDFDAMVTSGVISQETRDAIKAYMDEHKPEGEMPTAPAEGEALAEGEPNLLNDLLNAGIITQAEYDAMSAAA